mgnify:CR=1 FL=1
MSDVQDPGVLLARESARRPKRRFAVELILDSTQVREQLLAMSQRLDEGAATHGTVQAFLNAPNQDLLREVYRVFDELPKPNIKACAI